jgi:hypothetical protein
LQTFNRATGRKWNQVVREGWIRKAFDKWKRISYIPAGLIPSKKLD